MAAGAVASGTTLPLWSWRKKSRSRGRLAQRLCLAAPTPSVRRLSAGSPAGGTSRKVVRSCWEGELIRFTEGTRKEARWSDIIRYRFIKNVDRMIWNLPFPALFGPIPLSSPYSVCPCSSPARSRDPPAAADFHHPSERVWGQVPGAEHCRDVCRGHGRREGRLWCECLVLMALQIPQQCSVRGSQIDAGHRDEWCVSV